MSLLETFLQRGSTLSSGELLRFGEKLHALRVREEMTLTSLAAALGMSSHGYLSELEAGKKAPTASVVLRVARTFGVSTDMLMKDELPLSEKSQD